MVYDNGAESGTSGVENPHCNNRQLFISTAHSLRISLWYNATKLETVLSWVHYKTPTFNLYSLTRSQMFRECYIAFLQQLAIYVFGRQQRVLYMWNVEKWPHEALIVTASIREAVIYKRGFYLKHSTGKTYWSMQGDNWNYVIQLLGREGGSYWMIRVYMYSNKQFR